MPKYFLATLNLQLSPIVLDHSLSPLASSDFLVCLLSLGLYPRYSENQLTPREVDRVDIYSLRLFSRWLFQDSKWTPITVRDVSRTLGWGWGKQ